MVSDATRTKEERRTEYVSEETCNSVEQGGEEQHWKRTLSMSQHRSGHNAQQPLEEGFDTRQR